ncbi:MAG TPA: amidase [Vicinamibacterales bacterium]|nr:amidase [Vicinamibacterales bacterium]
MPDLDGLLLQPLEEVARLVAAREVSPAELTQAALARIERLQPKLNAFITVTAETALAEASQAEKAIAAGDYRGPLHGIPIAQKDLFDVQGVPTTAGMAILRDNVAKDDCTVVAMLRAAGAVHLGKLNLHEAAFGTSSANEHFGPVRNPWDRERVPGGSSGGSGAAVASGMCFAATGSDTGGSIRIPASECGVVGIMPTYGRVSLHGVFPLSWTLDHAGPLARTVRDAAIVLQAIAGRDPRDPTTADVPVPDYLHGIERGARGLRVGVPKRHFWDAIDPRVESAVRAAIASLEAAGADVRDVEFERAPFYSTLIGPIILPEAAAAHARWFPSRRDEYGREVRGPFDGAANVPAAAYARAMRDVALARNGEADDALEGVDVLAVPTLPEPPPKIEELENRYRDIRRTAYTSLFDATGQPVVTVPCGIADGAGPVGISFVARRWDEPAALRAARAWEHVRGPFPPPPLD